jgi:hypothetical protein
MKSARLAALVIFLGSFLLFGIQPMLGRTLLPSFGGSAAVWTVCLAAYQLLLLAGYFYAHRMARTAPQTQRRMHAILLALGVLWALAFATLRRSACALLGGLPFPAVAVLAAVMVFAGLPYVLLSANSTLVQAWLAAHDTRTGRGVYRLYAVSNLGSLLGLLAYPLLVEPFVSLNAQWHGFAVMLLAYTGLLAWVAHRTRPGAAGETTPINPHQPQTAPINPHQPQSNLPAPLARPWLWFALPALSTFLLNAVTLHLSTDFTPIPMLWALLLAAFLLSYVIGFSSIGELGLAAWVGLAVFAVTGASIVGGMQGGLGFMPNCLAGFAMLLFCCTGLHGWLYRIRPGGGQLTRFYLGLAAGGAAGGAASALLAPLLFDRVLEYPLALLFVCAAFFWLAFRWRQRELAGIGEMLMLLAVVAACTVVNRSLRESKTTLARARNFYGCLRVERVPVASPLGDPLTLHCLYHGGTLHGMQYREPHLRGRTTSYFDKDGGGLALSSHPAYGAGEPLRVGIIGLGVGTLAAYGRSGDTYRFYEINPQVLACAANTNYFTYLADTPATLEIVTGDARHSLEDERARGAPPWDVLVVDAYSGDSIPLHLATREAFQLYLDRLAPGGILAVHISNWHIDLAPLCKAVARTFDLQISGTLGHITGSRWVLLSRQPIAPADQRVRRIDWERVADSPLPSDEKGGVLHLVRLNATPPVEKITAGW